MAGASGINFKAEMTSTSPLPLALNFKGGGGLGKVSQSTSLEVPKCSESIFSRMSGSEPLDAKNRRSGRVKSRLSSYLLKAAAAQP
eukprot:CAMPEP_0206475548 /NCGR_PEP_ID=MMETSP0324_2-20121206/34150_1 /ASSEMBLY_ACC=CAM_ASM_000836 /TAXON_ID=2866 /ORGANISM="Crypthecodinium cohnii, Strain Seligo" /LENGTH=85 /DNA_ID=CAMNT_0053950937 /DNA_START=1341 /DNA_END=1598 /DNA_ORIENTATION=+